MSESSQEVIITPTKILVGILGGNNEEVLLLQFQ